MFIHGFMSPDLNVILIIPAPGVINYSGTLQEKVAACAIHISG